MTDSYVIDCKNSKIIIQIGTKGFKILSYDKDEKLIDCDHVLFMNTRKLCKTTNIDGPTKVRLTFTTLNDPDEIKKLEFVLDKDIQDLCDILRQHHDKVILERDKIVGLKIE